MKVREVIAFKDYFEKFLIDQPKKVQDKIFKIIEAIETLERVRQIIWNFSLEPTASMKQEYNSVQIFGACSVSSTTTD